jgi:stage II sporulation protein GA (sporulation sigma-E factor processing peptidase)
VVVYADILFAVNFAMNALVLGALRAVIKPPRGRWWVVLAAAVMALMHTLMVVVPVLQRVHTLPASFVILAAGVWLAVRPRTWRGFGVAMAGGYGITAAVGGAGTALFFLTGGAFAVFHMVDWRVAALAAAVSYGALKAGAKWLENRAVKRQTICEVVASMGSMQVAFNALVDTGHTLREPISGLPVIICEESLAAPLITHPNADTKMRVIPFTSLGQSAGLLTAVRCRVAVADTPPRDAYLAATPQKLCPHGRFRGLVGAAMLGENKNKNQNPTCVDLPQVDVEIKTETEGK